MKEYKTVYRCEFEFMGEVRAAISVEGIITFRDGFWVDEDYIFTKTGNSKYWIPPSRIQYISKDRVIDNG